MNAGALESLNQLVLASAFAIGIAFGALVQRTDFCTMGAVSDAVAMGDYTRMRQWALAAAVAIFGFAGFSLAGIVHAPQTVYASTRWLWLSAIVGGGLFGFGMALSSGCVSKTLVRLGAGSLKSLVVAIVAGLAAFATLRGLTAVWRVDTVDRVAVDFGTNADLATLLARAGLAASTASLLCAAVIGGALLVFALASRESRRPVNLLAGAGIGALVLATWWVTGHLGHLAEHPETLEETWLATSSHRAEGLSFLSPTAYGLDWILFFSDASKRLTVGIVTVAGVILGSAAVALVRRRFRWEGFADTPDLGHHLTGGLLMGVGGVTAMGCSIGQGVTGLSTLSLTSFTAAAAMIAGTVAGVRYQAWRMDRAA